MKHKLIKYNGTSIVTGDELKSYLEQINFKVNPISPVIGTPTDLIRPTVPKYVISDGLVSVHPLWTDYINKLTAYGDALVTDKKRYNDELNAVIEYLKVTFDGIVSYVKTGETNPNGTAKWAWFPLTAYSYRSCALKLTGAKRPENIIDFICYHYFGSQ